MRGTLICGVTGTDNGRRARLALEPSERFALRLVLACRQRDRSHERNGADGYESFSMRNDRLGAALVLAQLAAEYGTLVGDSVAILGQIAAGREPT